MLQHQLIMLTRDKGEAQSRTLLTMSSFQDGCTALRQSCGLQWLTQLLYGAVARDTRHRAEQALYNVVQANTDNQQRRIETRIFALLENLQDYCDLVQAHEETDLEEEDIRRHPIPSLRTLRHMAHDHSRAVTQMGGVHALAQLILVDIQAHCNPTPFCISVRETAVRALRDLTADNKSNIALLCTLQGFMPALVSLLESTSLRLQMITCELLTNLFSTGVDTQLLGAGEKLLQIAIRMLDETSLYALLNLSANYPTDKTEILTTKGALAFLTSQLMLGECNVARKLCGEIVKNISADIAASKVYRSIFRQHHGLHSLVRHLSSPEKKDVRNACATLRKLSAGCRQDQRILLELGAVNWLKLLVNSQSGHVAVDAVATLKNLRGSRVIAESRENVGSFNFSSMLEEPVKHVRGTRNTCRERSKTASDGRNKHGRTRKRRSESNIVEAASRKPVNQDGLNKHIWIEPERPVIRINSVYDTLSAVRQRLSLYEFSLMSDSEEVVGRNRHLSEETITDHKSDLFPLKDEICIDEQQNGVAAQHSRELDNFLPNPQVHDGQMCSKDATPCSIAETEKQETEENACEAASIADKLEMPEACETSINLCTKNGSFEVGTGGEKIEEVEEPSLDNQLAVLHERLYQTIQQEQIGRHLTVDSFRAVREIAAIPFQICVSRDAYILGVKLLACRADKSLGESYSEQVQLILTDDERAVHASVVFCGEVQNCELFPVRFQVPCAVSADLQYTLHVKYPRTEDRQMCLRHPPLILVSPSTGIRLSILEEVCSPISEVLVAEKVLGTMECRRG